MFRFTIRDVLWLTVVVAILCAFGAAQYRASVAARESARQAMESEKRAIEAAERADQ